MTLGMNSWYQKIGRCRRCLRSSCSICRRPVVIGSCPVGKEQKHRRRCWMLIDVELLGYTIVDARSNGRPRDDVTRIGSTFFLRQHLGWSNMAAVTSGDISGFQSGSVAVHCLGLETTRITCGIVPMQELQFE